MFKSGVALCKFLFDLAVAILISFLTTIKITQLYSSLYDSHSSFSELKHRLVLLTSVKGLSLFLILFWGTGPYLVPFIALLCRSIYKYIMIFHHLLVSLSIAVIQHPLVIWQPLNCNYLKLIRFVLTSVIVSCHHSTKKSY